jgi:hypothetical protein
VNFSIEQEFVMNVFACAFLVTMTIFETRCNRGSLTDSDSDRHDSNLVPRGARVAAITIALLSSLTLPYIYGKVIKSMELPSGRVAFDSADPTSTPPMKPIIDIADGLLVQADDKFVTLYRSDNFEFLHLGRNHVRYVAVDRANDIIRVYALGYCAVPNNKRR